MSLRTDLMNNAKRLGGGGGGVKKIGREKGRGVGGSIWHDLFFTPKTKEEEKEKKKIRGKYTCI